MDFDKLFYAISRSHSYWGRKPLIGLLESLGNLDKGDIFIDPFCGSGTPTIAALLKGAKVIACDINPMATFLTEVLVQPINTVILREAFNKIKGSIAKKIIDSYNVKCPNCGHQTSAAFIVWYDNKVKVVPETIRINCDFCKKSVYLDLTTKEQALQIKEASIKPTLWYPKTKIKSKRKSNLIYHYELFTGRNLTNLSILYNEIHKCEHQSSKAALLYVFSAILYSCSNMQMFSKDDPISSRGWTAPRFYVPPRRKEKNVWETFEKRFKNILELKDTLNTLIPGIKITHSREQFETTDFDVLLTTADVFDPNNKFPATTKQVFLDPPYDKDIEYLNLSDFWGGWMKMKFKFSLEKKFDIRNIITYSSNLLKILEKLDKEIKTNFRITLALSSKTKEYKQITNQLIKKGYIINDDSGNFIYSSPNSPSRKFRQENIFLILTKTDKPIQLTSHEFELNEKNETSNFINIKKYYQLGASLFQNINKENINLLASKVSCLIPSKYRSEYADAIKNESFLKIIKDTIKDDDINRQSYSSICFELLYFLFSKSTRKNTLTYLNINLVNNEFFSQKYKCHKVESLFEYEKECAFIIKNQVHNFVFCFDYQGDNLIRRIARYIYEFDNDKFKTIFIIIYKTNEDVENAREISNAEKYKRSFFISFEAIIKKANQINEKIYNEICNYPDFEEKTEIPINGVGSFKVKIKENLPIGKLQKTNLFKLKFESLHLKSIAPGQFIMLNTKPINKVNKLRPSFYEKYIDISKETIANFNSYNSYLKRPFGIHRTYYKYFHSSYLGKLKLPRTLSQIIHTIYPNEFDILYKVLPNGLGTNEMMKLKRGDAVEITGPLGKVFNLRSLLRPNVSEVHLIGGGVGIAPLIYIAQALSFFNIKTKAFIGIESYESLLYKYKDNYAPSFAGDKNNAVVYIDDLTSIGLSRIKDIFIAFQKDSGIKMKKGNYFMNKLISDPYEDYLKNFSESNVIAFACGPDLMMKKIKEIAKRNNIELYVLLEKRMACGIGVCFSCVCLKVDGDYSRICIEGPIYKAEEVVIENR